MGARFKPRGVRSIHLHERLVLAVFDQVYLLVIELCLVRVDYSKATILDDSVHAIAGYLYSKRSISCYALRHRHYSAWMLNSFAPIASTCKADNGNKLNAGLLLQS